MAVRERIQGKVAQLLNERELVINIGKWHGVQIGMKFKVLSDAPVEIRDPETEEVLGMVDREKVRVEAIEVQERLTICRTYEIRHIEINPLFYSFGISSRRDPPPSKIPKTLKAKDNEHLPPLSEEESYVKRGDRVIELTEEEQ
jgi:hypothetical protein